MLPNADVRDTNHRELLHYWKKYWKSWVLMSLFPDVLSRSWRFESGTSRFDINYYDNGIVIADCALCRIPQENIDRLYDFLLSENDKLENLHLSIDQNSVYLSYVIIDTSLTQEDGEKAFETLYALAPKYQKNLIDDFKALEPKFDEFE